MDRVARSYEGVPPDVSSDTPAEEVPETEPDAPAPARPSRRGWMVFCPHLVLDAVTDLDPAHLHAHGIVGVILDLDNTLVRWHRDDMTDAVMEWLWTLKAAGIKLCILSNSMLSRRSERIAERLGCPNIRQARKPSRSGFHRALEAMGTSPETTAIVGDQMFTDIVGGNRLGLHTVMVRPIHPKEFPATRYLSRPLERLLLHRFRRSGHL